MSNWYTATHPGSSFTTGMIAATRGLDRCVALRFDGHRALLFDRSVGCRSEVSEVDLATVPGILEERMGISHTTLREDGRVDVA
jgi:hypothetical protein